MLDSVVDLSIWGATLCWRGGGAPFVLRALNMNYWPIALPGECRVFSPSGAANRSARGFQVTRFVYQSIPDVALAHSRVP